MHQTTADILKAATPEQKILWNEIFLRFGDRVSVTQFVYHGMIAGSLLAVYDPRKLFLAYQIDVLPLVATDPFVGNLTMHDENNNPFWGENNISAFWNTGTGVINFCHTMVKMHNCYFSRLTSLHYDMVKLIGFRLGI